MEHYQEVIVFFEPSHALPMTLSDLKVTSAFRKLFRAVISKNDACIVL